MLTLNEVEKKRDEIKRRMRLIKEALTQTDDVDSLNEELSMLMIQAKCLAMNIKRHREMAEYLLYADPYGGPQ